MLLQEMLYRVPSIDQGNYRRCGDGDIDQGMMIDNDNHLVKLYDMMSSLNDAISGNQCYDAQQIHFSMRSTLKADISAAIT